MLSSDTKIRTESLYLLRKFKEFLSRDLKDFEAMVSSGWKGKLAEYEVDCHPFLKQELVLRMPPQISLYQDPLLYYIYCRPAQE